ncbi:hypothetical protein IHE45_16G032700 [Dioscorea alata]|uniref:Uncharacterized protein n=1 Tax=Dioscorea alata TaxID=55571 RepID=A0ACB7UGR4_DIOAL|nr:hypothetical protein IHE45_16G032700 [Dioscorea alata]
MLSPSMDELWFPERRAGATPARPVSVRMSCLSLRIKPP